ncbi:hypothetical protein LIER_11996 [Lithospermum erythrorhizon]|uniref:ZF-HD dimerization-type domain-containing protein n=1 Tax=Lithospermum erythrorhizon TaxID=34254 RepID=A0AAV3PSG2_LITER
METIATTTTIKTLEVESETLTRIHQAKPLSFSKDVLNHHHHHHGFTTKNHHHHAVVVTYKECLKNHAASMGGHSVDGCGEFMPSPNVNPSDPTSLRCAACGCHRNFHRREPEEPTFPPPNTTPLLEYQPHHRHHPPQPPPPPQNTNLSHNTPPSSPSPPPISSSYYKLLPLPVSIPSSDNNTCTPFSPGSSTNPSSRKRFRTKFTQEQKEKMLEFAEKIEWKIQNQDKEMINGFCNEIGVERGVLKVWMHNNKNTLGKKDQSSNMATIATTPTSSTPNHVNGVGVATTWPEES